MTTIEVLESLLDVREFARRLIGEPLWPHQEEVALSTARTVVMCCGRQAGKSRAIAVMALHRAFTRANYRVLILSAGEDSAKSLLAEISALAGSSLLAGSVVDDSVSRVVLSNGSWIKCVPASEKQVRGQSVDTLVLDEAAQISDELWRAARYSIIARPESRVVMASTPYGSRDRFFAQAFAAGQGGAEGYESFHWPSQASPLVSDALLQEWRRTDPEWVYRQEVLAEWVDDQQAYFAAEELMGAVADYEMWTPERARGQELFGGGAGVDWGFANDRSAVALVAPVDDGGRNDERWGGRQGYFVPLVEVAASRTLYGTWVDRLVTIAQSMRVRAWAAEVNGVGAMPVQVLRERLQAARVGDPWVFPVAMDAKRKVNGYGAIKVLLQEGRLILPRHAELLRQLNALQFTYSEKSGTIRIEVPERLGHDDAADALCHAVSTAHPTAPSWWAGSVRRRGREESTITTSSGLVLPEDLRPLPRTDVIVAPSGLESEAW